MTDIVLVNPPVTGKERYGALAGGGEYMPPLGLANLAAFIRQHGYSVKIVDCCVLKLTLADVVKQILSYKPKYVGITAVTISINKAAALAKMLKEQKPNLKIILGGCHISVLPEETMKGFSQFDIGVLGEGELTIVELLRVLQESSSLDNVKGIIFRGNGMLKINEMRPLIEDLDSLPFPAWDLLPDITKFYRPSGFSFKRLPITSLVTLRGCPMRCTFCNDGPFARTVRMNSPEYVIEMIKFLQRNYGIKGFAIFDGTFVIDKERTINICELMIKEKLNLTWSCNGRINLMTREILKLMKRAGCWLIAYGIESGSQQILDFIQKDIDLTKAYQVISWTREEGILAKGYFMIGNLKENEESIRSTLNFALRSGLDLFSVTYFTPLPGTLDYMRAKHYGKFNNNWYLLSFHNIVFIPQGLDKETIHFYRQYLVKRFYLRSRIILKYGRMLFNVRSLGIILMSFFALLNFVFLGKINNHE